MKKTKSNPSPDSLRVLILDDNPADAELVERALRRGGINFTSRLVKGKREFNKALTDFQPQVILSDFKLPLFDGLAALKTARLRAPDTPLIFVSGSIGEEKAIEMLAQGASDYIFKDNLQRLGPAVKRVVEETRLKLEKKKADEELQHHVDELRLLAEAADSFVFINDLNKIYDYLAQTIHKLSGADYLLLSLYDEKLQALRPKIVIGLETARETIRRRFQIDFMQMVFYLKDMRQDDFSDFVSRRLMPVRDGLYGIANRKTPRSICRLIEKSLIINSIYTMCFSWENQLFGGFTVFFKKGNDLQNVLQIEALANLAAVAIKRLLAEKSLRESEERFRRISATISDISYSCLPDAEGNFSLSWMTGAAERITGYTIEEIMAMKCWGKLVLVENQPDFEKFVTGLTTGNNGICELRLRHKNGNIIWVQSFAECAQNPEQPEQPILYGGLVNISERKNMYERLRQSEEHYRTLVEASPDAIAIIDGGGRITFASSKTYEIFGIPVQIPIIGTSMLDFVDPGDVPKVQKRMVDILSSQSLPQINEYRLLKHDRQPFWGEVSAAPLRNTLGLNIGLLIVCRDVSERKQAEVALRESEEKYRLIAENTAETITVMDLNLKFTYISPSVFKLRGYTVEESLSQTLQQSLTPDSFAKIQEIFSEEMALEESGSANPKRSRSLELQEYRKDGSISWIENSLLFLRDPQGKAIGFLAVAKDINERKQAEAEILREKAFLEKLVETAPEGIAITDCSGRVLRVNGEFVKMFGYEVDEVVGKKIDDLVVPPRYLKEAGLITQSVGDGETYVLETIRKRKDGTLINVSIIGTPIYIAGQQVAVYAIYRDISERKLAEEQIRTALKEKEVLLQEIHHRVKNNLQIISGLLTLQADQSAGKSLDEIFRASQDRIRSIAMIHEKLYRSHNLAEIAFDEYLRTLIENLFTSHGIVAGRITARYEMESIFFTIEKAIPLGLIVNELVTNALKHAFPAGQQGEIRIELHGYQGAKSYALKTDSGMLHCTPTCELIVADNGIGLPADQLPEQQKSLGMKLVSMLAKQIQAELKIKTGPGTEFRFLFPGLPAKETVKDKERGG